MIPTVQNSFSVVYWGNNMKETGDMRTRRRILSLLLYALTLFFLGSPWMLTVRAEDPANNTGVIPEVNPDQSRTTIRSTYVTDIIYLDCDENGQNWQSRICGSAVAVEDNMTTWNAGWYVVNRNVTLPGRVTVTGDVNLILMDNCTLTAENGGINLSEGNSLTIYGQSTGGSMGRISARGGSYQAGIGSDTDTGGGTITVNGGEITAVGGENSAGIGGGGTLTGGFNNGGNITINGGVIKAAGGRAAAGIGGGYHAGGGNITIRGGVITATGGGTGAGIGGGYESSADNVTIEGGRIYATGSSGIGNGGKSGGGGKITILGGMIEAVGTDGAGIGGSNESTNPLFITAKDGKSGNAVIFASGNKDGQAIAVEDDPELWNGVIFQGDEGKVYGNVTLSQDFEIPQGKSLTIPAGTSLSVPNNDQEIRLPEGGTVSSDGSIKVSAGGTVQIGKAPATIITPPAGGTITIDRDKGANVPEGSTVKPGNGGPEIIVGPGNGGTVGGDGSISVAGGGKVTLDGTVSAVITLPAGGGTVQPGADGTIGLPGGTEVEKGGITATVPDAGGIYHPDNGTVTNYILTVTFDSQGGSAVSPANITVPYGGKVNRPDTPVRSGYTFEGWYKESGCINEWNFDTDTVAENIILYAKWEQNEPDNPDKPDDSGEPDNPDKPNEPGNPDKPSKPNKPDKPDKHGSSSTQKAEGIAGENDLGSVNSTGTTAAAKQEKRDQESGSAPKTGDNGSIWLPVLLLLLGAGMELLPVFLRRR